MLIVPKFTNLTQHSALSIAIQIERFQKIKTNFVTKTIQIIYSKNLLTCYYLESKRQETRVNMIQAIIRLDKLQKICLNMKLCYIFFTTFNWGIHSQHWPIGFMILEVFQRWCKITLQWWGTTLAHCHSYRWLTVLYM